MSTPASIILRNAYGDGTEADIAHIYRHWDGYPGVCGNAIANAVIVASRTAPHRHAYGDGETFSALTNRNWAQHVLKALCVDDADLEFVDESRMPASEYTYVVTGGYDDFGGLARLTPDAFLYRINIECLCGQHMLFCGGVEAFSQWCEDYRF